MVEYALLALGNGIRSMATLATNWVSRLDWHVAWYVVLALVGLRFVLWAVNPHRPH